MYQCIRYYLLRHILSSLENCMLAFFFLVHPMHGPMHGKGLSLFQAKKNLHPTGDEYAHDHVLAERGFSYDKGIVYVLMERREAFYTLPFTLWPPESSF